MQTFFIVAILVLGFLITFQIAKASEYVSVMRGEEKSRNRLIGSMPFYCWYFLILGLIGVYYCNERLKGKDLHWCMLLPIMVIILTPCCRSPLLLPVLYSLLHRFFFSGFLINTRNPIKEKLIIYPHNNKLEVIWTVVPAIVLNRTGWIWFVLLV